MNQVQMAAQLYKCRDSLRVIYGDKFHEKMLPLMEIIERIANTKKHSGNVISAATEMAKGAPDEAAKIMILAAAVELVEPSQHNTSSAGG